jgi:prepilin-type N-terminal cleavage/methylation domain-containing protein
MITNTSAGQHRGFTLVELMIAIAILSVVAAIAIPAYNNYIREGHLATMRSTLNGLRTVIEDYHLDNGNFGATATLDTFALIDGRFGWNPGGDLGAYDYTVAVTGSNSYDVWGQFGAGGSWVRCENRYRNCCDSETPSATSPSNACP